MHCLVHGLDTLWYTALTLETSQQLSPHNSESNLAHTGFERGSRRTVVHCFIHQAVGCFLIQRDKKKSRSNQKSHLNSKCMPPKLKADCYAQWDKILSECVFHFYWVEIVPSKFVSSSALQCQKNLSIPAVVHCQQFSTYTANMSVVIITLIRRVHIPIVIWS